MQLHAFSTTLRENDTKNLQLPHEYLKFLRLPVSINLVRVFLCNINAIQLHAINPIIQEDSTTSM